MNERLFLNDANLNDSSSHRIKKIEAMEHVSAPVQPYQTPITSTSTPESALLKNSQTHCEKPAKSADYNKTGSTCILQKNMGHQSGELLDNPEELQPHGEPETSLTICLVKLNSENR